MKFIIFSILLCAAPLHAIEVSGGLRETFIAKDFFSYGGDSTFRIRRNLQDRKFDGIVLNTKLVSSAKNPSYLYRPKLSSKLEYLEAMVHQSRQGNQKVILKPQLVKPGSYEHISLVELDADPVNIDLLLHTYQKELAIYTNLSRKVGLDELVIGGGVNLIYSDIRFAKKVENFHRYIQNLLGDDSVLALNITSPKLLSYLAKHPDHAKLISKGMKKIYYNIHSLDMNSLMENENATSLKVQIEHLYRKHLEIFPELEFAISDVQLPLCLNGMYDHLNYICPKGLKGEEKLAIIERFAKLVVELGTSGIKISDIEILVGETDFEPAKPLAELFIYDREFKKLDIEKLFAPLAEPLPLVAPIPVERNFMHKACIYYDVGDTTERKDLLGRVHSETLVSLLGAFPTYGAFKKNISNYQPGELFECEKAFYLASNFLTDIPEAFLQDVTSFVQEKDLFWFNYKFNEFTEKIKDQMAFHVPFIIQPDTPPTAENTDIGFYQFFDYKGEVFFKDNQWNPTANNFTSSPEINFVEVKEVEKVQVLAWARHNKTEKRIPYAITQRIGNGSIWYIADSPFSFIHYEDRYLIFTDLLWDFLEVTPPTGKPKAMVRIEDVNPSLTVADLNWVMTYLASNDVPFSLALIPYFSDLTGATSLNNHNPIYQPITKFKDFLGSILYAKSLGADMVYHGVAHTVDDFISGYDGVSGDDYEFWLYPENVPIPYDSVDWVMDRLEMGEKVLDEIGIVPDAWEIPHYAASVLDYYMFGKLFEWTYHRSVLFHHDLIQDTALPAEYRMFVCKDQACRDERRAILRNIKVDAEYATFGASLYPYPIHHDNYGQKVIPETLGMVDYAYYAKDTWRPVSTPEDILRRAKKLKVIRGAIASFFWHTHLLNPKLRYYFEVPGSYEKMGGKRSMQMIVEGLKELGYEFISIKDCKVFPRQGCEYETN